MFTFLFTVYVVECWIGLVCDAISNVGLEMGFAVAFHHMGRFERNRGLKYVGGEIHVVSGIDPDFWSFFEALGIVKEFKYAGDVRLWWKGSKETLLNNLRLLSDDKEALALAKYAEDRNEEVDIYVQHIPCQPEVVHFITGPGMDEEVGQEEVGVEAQRCETEIGVDGGPVGETDIGIEGDEEVQVEKKVEAQRCETDIGVEGDQEVHVQQEEVEVEQGVEQEDGEPEQRVEAQQGVEAEQEVEIPQVGGDEDVVVEDVSDKDEGSDADKLIRMHIPNSQAQSQGTPSVSAPSSAAGPSTQSCSSRRRSRLRVAANVNQEERPPTTQTRSMVAQVIGSQASTATSAQPT